MLTWEELAGRALARQFPADDLPVETLLATTGPVQSQTARSPFVGLAARSTIVTRDVLSAAYDDGTVVRGSTIRGTVHTTTPGQQRPLDVVTRLGQASIWRRSFGLDEQSTEALWASVDVFAREEWRTVDDLVHHVRTWLVAHERAEGLDLLDRGLGRYLTFGVGLVRRPANGDWAGQGTPEYRSAAAVAGLPAVGADEAVDAAVLLHLSAHGPASRQDLAWWSGLPLRTVDAGLSRLSAELVAEEGPLGRTYHDLPDAPPARDVTGVRLLPEFDALLCGYDSKARDRFVAAEHHAMLWNATNGMILPPLLVDGRITGWWRAAGSARRRALDVRWFAGTRRPRRAELDEAVARLQTGLGIEVTAVSVTKAA